MEQGELDLWRMVDVGWYNSCLSIFNLDLDSIREKVQKGETDVQGLRDSIKDYYVKISARFEGMNLELLDDGFPVDVLGELRGNVIPTMGKRYDELDALLTQYASGSAAVEESIISKISECLSLVARMDTLGNEFEQNKGYREYRKTNPDRIYLE